MNERIFVSCARKNEDVVRPLIDRLIDAGLNLWVYYRDIKPGRNWRVTARDALVESDKYLVFLSPESLDSLNVRNEIYLARAYRKPIIPVMLSDCWQALLGHDETRWLQDRYIINARGEAPDPFLEIMRATERPAEPIPLNSDRIFITYADPDDRDFAVRLAGDLRGAGGNVWIDAFNIHGGINTFEARTDGLMNAQYLVICLSLDALASVQVRRDLLLALSRNMPIVPVITERATDTTIQELSTAVMSSEETKELLDINWIRQRGDYARLLAELREAFDLHDPSEKRRQGIFISYRRADSADACGRIYDRLSTHFGVKTVFKDVMDIPPGVHFADHIRNKMDNCAVALVLISNRWSTVADSNGQRRLDSPDDLVRIEVEQALNQPGMLVIPVLLGGTYMPNPTDLPATIRDLTMRNAVEIRHDPDFHHDVDRLIAEIERSQG